MPNPPFGSHFTGYSMMEDLTLSSLVRRHGTLVNARTARIFHDTQPGTYKSDPVALSKMELVNRYFVMTRVLGRTGLRANARLALWEGFQLLAALRQGGISSALSFLKGKLLALPRLFALPRTATSSSSL
jgi:hypothetical protein